jgi:imidazolonepropionase-like amidohydrolase
MAAITGDRVKLANARIADVENDCYFGPEVSLVIQNGKIAAMPGLPGEPEAFPADAVIDLHGLTVIPGLFNTHCHVQFIMERGQNRDMQIARHLADCADRGVTNIRDTLCWDLGQNQSFIQRIASGQIPGPRIHQAIHISPVGGTYAPLPSLTTRLIGMRVGNYERSTSGVVTFRPSASPREVRDAVDRAVDERGAAAIKLCDQREHFMTYKPGATVMSSEQLEAAVDQATRRGVPTTLHNVTVDGFRQGVKAGITSLAHVPIDGELTEDDAARLRSSQTSIEPTLTVGYYMSFSMKGSPFFGHPEIQRLDAYRNMSYDALVEESWLPGSQKQHRAQFKALQRGEVKLFGFVDISAPFRYMSSFIPVGGNNLRLLVEQGNAGRLGCGSDAGASNCSPAVIDQELSMLDFILNRDEKQLFTAADALRTATLQSARSMGVEAQFGSIRPGKTADLVVLDGDPLQDFHMIGRPVQALFMDGNLVINRCGLQLANPVLE